MTDWSSRIASITGAAGFVVGGAAYLTSRRATKASERSATASEGSAEAAKASAASSDRAAGAAERSAAETEAVGGITRSQRHDELSPQRNGLAVTFELVPNRTTGGRNLFATITADRSYRAVAIGRYRTAGTHDVGQFVPLVAGSPERVNVEMLAADRAEPETRDLLLHFWPPADVDRVEQWECRCGRAVMKGPAQDPQPHWETVVSVPPFHRPRVTVM